MSRSSKGARLYLRPARRDKNGKIRERATWIIRDGEDYISTGCVASEIAKAEEKLSAYIAEKYEPIRKVRDLERIHIADVLNIFVTDRRESQANKRTFDGRIDRLNAWWGDKTLAEVNGPSCREYARIRKAKGGARRDLEDLRAAIRHHAKEGYHRGEVYVVLPEKGQPRDRWLTRSEAARLLWACLRTREVQKRHRGRLKNQKLSTKKYPLRHLARFLIIGFYTGTRAAAIAAASPYRAIGRSFVDLDRGIFYRLQEGKKPTKKRQPPIPLPPRLLAHMRRWKEKKLIARSFVEFNGKEVQSVKTALKHAVKIAKLEGRISAHVLRHTAATWMMMSGTDPWQAAGYLGMKFETLMEVYGHHHPDYLWDAVEGITRKPKRERSKVRSAGISAERKSIGRKNT
jgi:integrase